MNIYILKFTMLIKTMIVVLWAMITSIGIPSLADMINVPSGEWLDWIFTTDNRDIIAPPDDNAMMKGTHTAVDSEKHQISDISDSNIEFTEQEDAEKYTFEMVHRLINWILGMLAFVALIVVIIGWIQMVTAAGDDAKYKSWKTALKKVSIGIIGIGASWLLVSFFFWIVDLIS